MTPITWNSLKHLREYKKNKQMTRCKRLFTVWNPVVLLHPRVDKYKHNGSASYTGLHMSAWTMSIQTTAKYINIQPSIHSDGQIHGNNKRTSCRLNEGLHLTVCTNPIYSNSIHQCIKKKQSKANRSQAATFLIALVDTTRVKPCFERTFCETFRKYTWWSNKLSRYNDCRHW